MAVTVIFSMAEGAIASLTEEIKKLRESHEEMARKVGRSGGRKDSYRFKRKANEAQHKFNEEVEGALEEAEDALQRAGPSEVIEKAKNALKDGKELIARRQKLLKLADRSEYGWAMVEEYEEDDLADDEEDEKKIERAERAAEKRMAKKRKEAFVAKRGVPQVPDSRAKVVDKAGPAKPLFAPGICFQCGEVGHLRRDCPKRLPVAAEYPLLEPERGGHVQGTCQGVDRENVTPVMEVIVGEIRGESHGVAGTSEDCCVRGKLKGGSDFWRDELCAPPWVMDTISNGYVLPLMQEPPGYYRNNQKSALMHAAFVDRAIKDLLTGGYVEKVLEKPKVCSPLSVVVTGSGKKRLVVNLRHVNQYLWKQKFKYEDLRVAMTLFDQGELMFTFDLKSGYHHVEIVKHHRQYLGFRWGEVYYQFAVLPFGLASAPYAFTKLLRPLVRYWRAKGLKIVLYLDDGICAVKGLHEANVASQWVQSTLRQAGLVVNEAKSSWVPCSTVQWLGFVVDMEQGCISVPPNKVSALRADLKTSLEAGVVEARVLASVIGKIISMGLALGLVSRFRTRSMYALLGARLAWCSILPLSEEKWSFGMHL